MVLQGEAKHRDASFCRDPQTLKNRRKEKEIKEYDIERHAAYVKPSGEKMFSYSMLAAIFCALKREHGHVWKENVGVFGPGHEGDACMSLHP